MRPIEALRVRWWVQQGRLTEALGWVRESGLSVDDSPNYLREYEHLTLARVAMAEGRSLTIAQHKRDSEERIHQVIDLLTQLLAAVEAKKRTASMIEILVVLALAYEAKGDVTTAISPLERALTLAESESYGGRCAEGGSPQYATAESSYDSRHHNRLYAATLNRIKDLGPTA